ALVSLLLLLGERTAFLRAVDTWYIRDDQGERGAYLRRDPRHSEHLTLCSVAATPRGHGLGDQLLTAILAHTDAPLRLWAVNRRVAHWYSRHGFAPQRRGLRGTLMTRPATRTGTAP